MPEIAADRFTLNYPHHVAAFDTYPQAQAAVDYLADNGFPVENLLIVGTDLKSVERVTGRRTWGTVLGQGAVGGLSTGVLVGLMLYLFSGGTGDLLLVLMAGLALGVVFGLVSSALAYWMTLGKRDFDSLRQIVATSYEVLSEHKVSAKAKELLDQRPGERAKQFR
ncbi:MAG: general stress protein [Arachnia sp.]